MTESTLDRAILGGGLRGLRAGLAALRAGERCRVIEAEPEPGGTTRTQRTEGYVCELGPFAWDAAELSTLMQPLSTPPPVVQVEAAARQGWTWDGSRLSATGLDGEPLSFRGGSGDLIAAMRRELGPALQLGRPCTSLRVHPYDGMLIELGGEVPSQLATKAVHLCLPIAAAARLLARFDPNLAATALWLRMVQRALVFLGTWQDEAATTTLRGYGIRVDEQAGPTREVVFCTNAFARRAMPGKALIRCEVEGDVLAQADEAVALAAEQQLRTMTGWEGRVLFRRVHRLSTPLPDGAWAECRVRLRDLAGRMPGLLVD